MTVSIILNQAVGYCFYYFWIGLLITVPIILDEVVGYCSSDFGSGCWWLFRWFWIRLLITVPIILDQAVGYFPIILDKAVGYCSHYFGSCRLLLFPLIWIRLLFIVPIMFDHVVGYYSHYFGWGFWLRFTLFWIRLLVTVHMKNSKDMLEYIQSRSLSSCNIIKTFHFSTLYTTIPHSMLNDRLRNLIQLYFIKKNGQRRYKYIVLGRDLSYFVKKTTLILPTNSLKLISSTCSSFWLTTYLLSLVDVFFNRQSAYLLGTNYAPLLADLFLYLYEADFIQGFSRKAKILSLNNSRFSDFVERIYPNEL